MMEQQTITTGKPCARGHVAARRADNHDCLECVRLRQRAWYEKNREADLARKAEWVRNNLDRKRAFDAAYYEKNREKIKAKAAAYYAADREVGRARCRAYAQKNADVLRVKNAARYAANPERANAYSRTRKALKRGAEGRHTTADIKAIAKAQKNRCAYCSVSLRKVVRHVDHIVPLSRGGSNWPRNLQLLCAPCNLSKHASDPID